LVVVLALPAGFGIAAVAPFLVPVMLGEKWLAAIPIVSVLAIYGALNALQTNCTAVHYSLGRPRNITVISAIQIVFLLPLAIWGAYRGGAVGIAYAYLVYVVVISLPLNYVVVLRALGMPFRRLLSSVWRPLVGSVAMYSVVAVLVAYLREPSLLFLAAAIVAGAAVYAASVLLLWLMVGRPGGPEKTAVDNFVLPTWNKFVAARAVR
jgi:lipopolysaccharide exporter